SHEARRHGVQLQPWFDHHDGARGVEAQLARYNRDRTGGRPGRHGVSAACGSMAWIWRTVRFQFYDVREFYLGGVACRVDPIRYRMGTCHVPLVHPLMVAKMAATIDHVTNGRFALNVVC